MMFEIQYLLEDDSDLYFTSGADLILDGMRDILDRYGFVSAADLFDLIGRVYKSSQDLFEKGWDNLDSAYIQYIPESNGYNLRLPSITTQRKDDTMSERQEKKRRYNARLEYISHFDKWLESEPPMIRIFAWRKWKKNRPIYKEELEYAEA